MDDKHIRSMMTALMQPIFDTTLEQSIVMMKAMMNNMPSDIPIEEQRDIMKSLIKAQSDAVVANYKAVIPSDIGEKIKEEVKKRYGK